MIASRTKKRTSLPDSPSLKGANGSASANRNTPRNMGGQAARGTQQAAHQNRRYGFTLLEVLITSLLMSMILASLWALSHVYTQSFKTGSFKIEESQIVRSLRQQFTDDISGAIPIASEKGSTPTSLVTKELLAQSQVLLAQLDQNLITPSGSSTSSSSGTNNSQPSLSAQVKLPGDFNSGLSSSSSAIVEQTSQREPIKNPISLPTFQLVGSSDSLQLQILQLVPSQSQPSISQLDENTFQAIIPAPELRTIEYTFQPPPILDFSEEADDLGNESAADEEEPSPSGLMRKEQAWVLPSLLSRYKTTRFPQDDEFDSQSNNQLDFTDTALLNEIVQSGAHDDEITWVPEVIAMEFRYYDGQIWQSSWDSRESKKLPVAIEIAFRIQSVVEQKKAAEEEITVENLDRTLETSLFDEDTMEVEDPDQEQSEGSRNTVTTYRHLIKLPLGELKLEKRDLTNFSSGVPPTGNDNIR